MLATAFCQPRVLRWHRWPPGSGPICRCIGKAGCRPGQGPGGAACQLSNAATFRAIPCSAPGSQPLPQPDAQPCSSWAAARTAEQRRLWGSLQRRQIWAGAGCVYRRGLLCCCLAESLAPGHCAYEMLPLSCPCFALGLGSQGLSSGELGTRGLLPSFIAVPCLPGLLLFVFLRWLLGRKSVLYSFICAPHLPVDRPCFTHALPRQPILGAPMPDCCDT